MLNVIEYQGQRVLTTAQIAECYQCKLSRVYNNFQRDKGQFVEGVHYFKLTDDALRHFKRYSAKIGLAIPPAATHFYLWTIQGAALLADLLLNPHAFDELKRVYFNTEARHDANNMRQIIEVEGVRGYNGDDGFVYLDAEDVARGLGFIHYEEKFSPTSGRKNYESIRWERINGYLADFGCPPIHNGDFIPESMFYLLAMKANNETAKKFQLKIANEILPSIRKHGYYSVNEQSASAEQPVIKTINAVDLADLQIQINELREEMEEVKLAFKELAAALNRNADAQLSKRERADKLLEIADRLKDDDTRDKLYLQAANLINGKKLL